MEVEMKVGSCVLCCDSVNPSTDGDERDTTINKFWKQISSEDGGKVDHLVVCVECLASVAIATEERENAEKIEVELRFLQRQVLTLLKGLQGCMSGYLTEMRIIEEKIKRSKVEARLDTEKMTKGRKTQGLDAFQFRDGIVNVVKDLSLFQDQLSLKVNLAPDKDSSNLTKDVIHLSSRNPPRMKIELEDREEEPPEFYDDDSPSSPLPLDQVDEKVNLNISVDLPRRSLRRSVAAAATSCRSADLHKKPHNKRQEICSKKKRKPKVKTESTSPPEKIVLPSWVKETHNHQGTDSRRRYTCDICPSFISRYPYTLEQHLREHEQEVVSTDTTKSFACGPCNLSFSLKQLYEYHMGCHKDLFKFCCELCNNWVPPLELVTHFKDAHGATKMFHCDNCIFCCTTRDRYLQHIKRYHTGNNVVISCDLCSEKFNKKNAHLRHLYDKHRAIEKLKCEIEGCSRTFLDPCARRSHQYLHTKPFTCLECDKPFADRAALEIHKSAHTTARTWKCSRCPKAFKSKTTLYAHEKLHDRDEAIGSGPAFQCHLCEKSFMDKSTFKGHLRLHQGMGFTCDQCGLKFREKCQLKKHMVTHETGEKFFCEHCGKGFRCLAYLRTHRRTQHDNPKRFECKVCHKMFRDPGNLKQHSVVHTGAKPFQCQICGKGFTQSHTLKHHKKHSHPDEKDATSN